MPGYHLVASLKSFPYPACFVWFAVVVVAAA